MWEQTHSEVKLEDTPSNQRAFIFNNFDFHRVGPTLEFYSFN